MESQLEVARRFAKALDACDYRNAGEVLAANCRYDISPGNVRIGRVAILESFRESDARARSEFDAVEYSSEAVAVESGRIRLDFTDLLWLDRRSHAFQCGLLVTFDGAGQIDHIELQEFPGERDRLDEFRAAAGVPSTRHR